jgi:hypothetical protein
VFHHQVILYTVESEAGKTRLKMKGLVRQGKDPAHSEKLERRETCDKLSGGSLASHFVQFIGIRPTCGGGDPERRRNSCSRILHVAGVVTAPCHLLPSDDDE